VGAPLFRLWNVAGLEFRAPRIGTGRKLPIRQLQRCPLMIVSGGLGAMVAELIPAQAIPLKVRLLENRSQREASEMLQMKESVAVLQRVWHQHVDCNEPIWDDDRKQKWPCVSPIGPNTYSLYFTRNHAERDQLLKSVLLNCTTDGVSLTPTYRKPFDLVLKFASISSGTFLFGMFALARAHRLAMPCSAAACVTTPSTGTSLGRKL
jgi:hypothetical protein